MNTKKIKFKNVAHLYIGSPIEAKFITSSTTETIKGVIDHFMIYDIEEDEITSSMDLNYPGEMDKPILRNINTLTNDELKDLKWESIPDKFSPCEFAYLLKHQIDLFGLIESKQAISSQRFQVNPAIVPHNQ